MRLAAISVPARLPRMARKPSPFAAAALLLSSLLVAGCGRDEPEGDPAAIDAHLNAIVARDDAERARLVTEARAREAVRMREMEQNEQNYAEMPD